MGRRWALQARTSLDLRKNTEELLYWIKQAETAHFNRPIFTGTKYVDGNKLINAVKRLFND